MVPKCCNSLNFLPPYKSGVTLGNLLIHCYYLYIHLLLYLSGVLLKFTIYILKLNNINGNSMLKFLTFGFTSVFGFWFYAISRILCLVFQSIRWNQKCHLRFVNIVLDLVLATFFRVYLPWLSLSIQYHYICIYILGVK